MKKSTLKTLYAVIVAALVFDSNPRVGQVRAQTARTWWLESRLTIGTLVAIVLIATILRLVWLDVLPFGTWYDEAEYGLQALRILANADFRPVFEGAINGPAHYLYLVGASFQMFGESTASIRLVNVLFGVGTVLAAYGVGRELFGRKMGLVFQKQDDTTAIEKPRSSADEWEEVINDRTWCYEGLVA